MRASSSSSLRDDDDDDDEVELIILDAPPEEGHPILTNESEPRVCRYVKYPFRAFRHYAFTLNRILTWRFIVFLLFSQMLSKGMLYTFASGYTLPLFKNVLHVGALDLQIYNMIIMLPWTIKPLLGICSDYILLFGYRKRWWLMIGAATGTACSSVLLGLRPSNAVLIVCFLTGVHLEIALYDLLSEAKYSEIRNDNAKDAGSSISTLVIFMQALGSLIAISCVGVLADQSQYTIMYIITAALCAAVMPVTILGWLPEPHPEPPVKAVRLAISRSALRAELPIILVVVFCGCAGIVSNIVVNLSPTAGLIVATLLLVASVAGTWAAFPRAVTQVALYQVITTLSRPSLGSAMDYFYTADAVCVPNGPHFSYTYYVTVAGFIGTILGLVGIFIYEVCLGKLRFRVVLLIITLLVVVGALSDLFIVTRTNIAWGISDQTAYILGEAVLEPLLDMLAWIPTNALISMAAPKGKESSSFALMAGLSNYAKMVAGLSGAVIFNYAGVVGCNFDALPALIIMCYIVLPLLGGIPSIFLIPNVYQNETLGESSSSGGAP